jgi:hypothetical protein
MGASKVVANSLNDHIDDDTLPVNKPELKLMDAVMKTLGVNEKKATSKDK